MYRGYIKRQTTGKRQINSWKKEFFTIDENIKYQMQKEGYRLEDLEKGGKTVGTDRKKRWN